MIESRTRVPIIGLLAGSGVSLLGNLMTLVALPWFVLQTTGSAAQTGITSAVWLLPVVLSGVLGGPVVDRLGHRRAILTGDVVSGLAIGLIPLLHITVGLAFWQLLVLVFIRGLFDIPGRTARRALLPDLAQMADMPLERANSAFIMIRDVGSLAGPALAGVLIALIGPENVLVIDAATYFVSAIVIAVLVPVSEKTTEEDTASSYLADLAQGIRFVRGHQLILSLLLTSTIVSFLSEPLYGVLLPVYSDRVLGSAVDLGLILAAFGAGSLLGTFLFGIAGHRLSRRPMMISAVFGMALPFLVLATLPSFPVTAAAIMLTGFITAPFSILFATILQEQVPANMRGRVFGLDTTIGVTGMPLGVMIAGFLIEGIGLRVTLLLQAAAFACLGVALLLNPAMSSLRIITRDVNRTEVRD